VPKQQNDLLRELDETLAGLTGPDFFRALVRALAEGLQMHCSFVCEFTDDNRVAQPFAFWIDGEMLDGAAYTLEGTPCETVLGGEVVAYEHDVCEHFPLHRAELEAVRAVSYLAIPMKSRDGEIMGHVAVIDSNPRSFVDEDLGLLRLCASRATAELEHLRTERDHASSRPRATRWSRESSSARRRCPR
jgi:formate hydrogenlyase transcriptional activator